MPVDVGLDRATKRGEKDRIEVEKVEFFEDVRTAYLALAKDEPKRFAIIDATQPPEQVKLDVLATINTLLNKF